MRLFSLFFALIALIVLAQFVIYVVRGPVEPFFAVVIFISFLLCAGASVFLLKPFEGREELERRRERRKRRREDEDR